MSKINYLGYLGVNRIDIISLYIYIFKNIYVTFFNISLCLDIFVSGVF